MTAEAWARVRELLGRALELPEAERLLFLERADTDPATRDEVRRLLGFDHAADRLFRLEDWQSRVERTSAEPNLDGTTVGSYRLLRELGRGGMGTVYLAERADGVYQQAVAVKILQESIHTPALAERFRRERQILARLQHPGVARLLDGGVLPDGRPYLVLEYVDGLPIDRYADEHALDTEARLRLFLRVADVVQSAHQQLVLHLDLKPANILVTAAGEPRLLDFGIARLLEGTAGEELASRQTEATLRLLTPRYASPEQATGAPLGVASDVFSLGTLLYRLLTGRLPYPIEDAPPLEAARMLAECAPLQPSAAAGSPERAQQLRGDLDTILLQALRKEPARRYPTVAALASDLRSHLALQPVAAHADSFGYRAGKFLRRNKVSVAAAAVSLLVLVASSVAVVHAATVARRNQRIAERRLHDVRSLARSYVFDLDPKLEQIAGTAEVRHFVLVNAQRYLEAMAQEAAGDDDLTREVTQGLSRIGQVQETPGVPSLDDLAGAEQSMARGVALQKALLARHPDYLPDRELLMMQMRHWVQLPDMLGDVERTNSMLGELWQISQPLLAAGPTRHRYLDLSSIADSQALIFCGNSDLWNLADPLAATPWFDREEQIARAYSAAHPAETENMTLIGTWERLALGRARVLEQTGRAAEARPLYEEALAWTAKTHGELVEDEARKIIRGYYAAYLLSMHDVAGADRMMVPPGPPSKLRTYTADDADALALMARIDLESGRLERGRERMRAGLGSLEELHRAIPADENVGSELAWDTLRLGEEPALDASTRAALLHRALELGETYGRRHPTVLSASMLIARAELGLATVRPAAERHAHAARAAAEAARVLAAHPIQPAARALRDQAEALLRNA